MAGNEFGNRRIQSFRVRSKCRDTPLWPERCRRLEEGEKKILYHQTNHDAAAEILRSRRLLRGTGGCAGPGIYFAISIDDAKRKARSQGVLMTCFVKLGKVLDMGDVVDNSVTFTTLFHRGYDSVSITRPTGLEYVVYCSEQVEILEAKCMVTDLVQYVKPVDDEVLEIAEDPVIIGPAGEDISELVALGLQLDELELAQNYEPNVPDEVVNPPPEVNNAQDAPVDDDLEFLPANLPVPIRTDNPPNVHFVLLNLAQGGDGQDANGVVQDWNNYPIVILDNDAAKKKKKKCCTVL